MPVAKLKKIDIISADYLKADIIEELEKVGAVQVVDFNIKGEAPVLNEVLRNRENNSAELDVFIHQLQYCLDFIQNFLPSNQRKSSVNHSKSRVARDQLIKTGSSFPLRDVFEKCQALDHKLTALKTRENTLNHLKDSLTPWTSLDFPLEDAERFSEVEVIFALINNHHTWSAFQKRVEEEIGECSHWESFSLNKNKQGVIIITLKEKSKQLKQILREFSADILQLPPDFKGPPRDILNRLEKELTEIEAERGKIQQEIQSLSTILPDLILVYDYAQLLKTRKEIESRFVYTDQTLLISGWVVSSLAPKLKNNLYQKFKEIEVLLRDPFPGEDTPVLLTNPFPIKPFERITQLYSLPNNREFDPTPFLFPFFFLFFGICLSEAGYGIIISLLFYLAWRRLYLSNNTKDFFILLTLGGLSSIFFGTLTGSWFGDLIDLFPEVVIPLRKLKDSLIIINPVQNPIPALIFALSLGTIQVYTGILLKMIMSFHAKEIKKGLLNQGTQVLLLTAFIVWILSNAKVLPIHWKPIITWVFIGSLLLTMVVRGQDQKNIFMRLGAGAFATYDLVGYLGDILSYSRLFALGLATGVVAIIVNTLIITVKDIPWIGIILVFLIFTLGHLFNLVLSTLGAFIHSLRLQYVEFFTKFYEGGGKPFEPYRIKTKYVEIIPDTPC
jgi:V/A-type H+-transporting ATPase subunit I